MWHVLEKGAFLILVGKQNVPFSPGTADGDAITGLRFYLDAETGQPHIYDRGVTEEEVWEVLRRPGEDRAGEGDSRVAIGQTATGRHLKVI